MSLTTQLLNTAKIIILALILAFGISYLNAAWSPPTATPPSGNTPAPINVGSVQQARSGSLIVNNIFTAQKGFFTDWVTIGDFGINPDGNLLLDVEGAVGATEYCDQNGQNCVLAADIGGGGDTDWTEVTPGGTGNIYRSLGSVGIGDDTPDAGLKLDVEGAVGAALYCDEHGLNCQTISQLLGAGKICPVGQFVTGFDASGSLICAEVEGAALVGPITLVNGIHTSDDCAAAGGNTKVDGSDTYVCEFSGGSCPAGWAKYLNWSTGASKTCFAQSNQCQPPGSCSTAGWGWANTSQTKCTYYNSTFGPGGVCNYVQLTCLGTVTSVGCY